jgi:hypothetical protein
MATQFNVKNFLSGLLCPIGFDPLTKAVSLIPCCHKVNQAAAERYYGKIVNGFCELREKPCVICKTPIVAYAPDPLMRDLVAQIFGPEKEDLEALPAHPLVLETPEEKKAILNIPYPGLPAVFVWAGGEWNQTFAVGDLRRQMRFQSITANSVLEAFNLLGYSDGSVSISVRFGMNSPFIEYLKAHRIVCAEFFCHKTHTPAELKTLFRIITQNNEIPSAQLKQISEIVENYH